MNYDALIQAVQAGAVVMSMAFLAMVSLWIALDLIRMGVNNILLFIECAADRENDRREAQAENDDWHNGTGRWSKD